jgi:MATE family multidrug resistance protein
MTVQSGMLETTMESPAVKSGWELRKMVFWLALPAVGEQVLNTFVGLTDQYLVGNLDLNVAAALGYDRATAIAAVGLSGLVIWIVTTLFMAVATGATTVVARRIGEGRPDSANLALQQAMLISLVVGFVGTGIAFIGEPMLRMLGAAPEVVQAGASYLRIVSWASIPTALTFAGTAALRGAGDTRSPLWIMLVVNGINIIFSWLLVNGNSGFPALGVEGSAIGTAVARTVGGFLTFGLLMSGVMKLRLPTKWAINPTVMQRITKIGLPSAGEQFVFQGAVLIMSGLIAQIGTAAYAAHSVTINIESVSFLPGFGFAVAATALVGQALGAKDPELARRATNESFLQGGIMMSVLGVIMALFPEPLIAIIAPDPEVIHHATNTLRLAGLAQPFLAMSFIFIGALRGAGDATWPLGMRVVTTWIIRVPLMFLLLAITDWGLTAIWVAMVTDFVVQAFLALRRFQEGKWQRIKV